MPAKGRLPMTVKSVDRYVTELRKLAVKLAEISRIMHSEKIETLEVMNQPTAEQGLLSFERLTQSCEREIARARREKVKNF